ncbi:hypothetical protein [Streptomyces xanthii]|uniref:DUF1579 domain-containing protein n=1 Tax=Streptomyces xanthii TaxID=2768069 RepID=A0A7H1B503_9ACTN|nr:hypothetical protein [Streptomyces xanthii]QNS03808.1 hypothetical protein IAG42_09310 [Streptomyces xanthii]
MLGETIGEEQGRTTGMRVLSTDGGHPVTEASFQASGTLLGVEIQDTGTYESVLRPDGTLWGEGQGFNMTKDGETVTWHGSGVGRFVDGGAVEWRGAIFFETAATKFERLNTVAGVFEFRVEADGKAAAKLYEWK